MTEAKRDNTARFTGKAEDYDRYRQRYPAEEILGRLRAWCGLTPEWLIADIGAGTGMVAEIFLANGNPVIAIEPNSDMLGTMRAAFAARNVREERLQIAETTAEDTTLESGSVDMVAIGRAFHWFDKDRALAEFKRILKPGGWVVLVAADRDREPKEPVFVEQMAAYEDLLAEHGTDYKLVRSGYRTYEKMDDFLDGELHQAQAPSERRMDWEEFRGQILSLSVSPRPEDPGYAVFEQALLKYFDRFAREGVLTVPTICWITAGRFAESV
jgi:SAM-dependent methyltransferase